MTDINEVRNIQLFNEYFINFGLKTVFLIKTAFYLKTNLTVTKETLLSINTGNCINCLF